jgi:hypothetical protein
MRPLPFPKLHKSTGQAYVKHQRKMYYFGRYGTPGADQKYWEWRAGLEGVTPKIDAPAAPAMPEVINKYIASRIPGRNKVSQLRMILEHCTGALGKMPVTKFGPLAFKHLRENIAGTGTRCVGHVNALMRHLQLVFRWMVSEEIVPLAVWQELKTVDPLKSHPQCKPTRRRVPVSPAVVASTLPYLAAHCADMVRLIVATGARPGEILSLTAEEVVKEYRHREDRKGWWYAEKTKHKTSNRGKKRWIEFPPGECQEILTARWPVGGYFFPASYDFGHYRVASLRQHVWHTCEQMHIPRWNPAQLRHLKLTDLACKEGVEAASRQAGHSGLRITDTYIHEPPKQAG